MRIICPNCRSEYEFDGSRVSSRGTKVKCSSCEHVFTVYRVDESRDSGEVEESPPSRPKTRRIGKLGGEKLLLRQEGREYPIQNLSLLQRWIVEKRVLATDEVSIDGESWELVSRLSELRPFFAVLRQLRETRRELSATRERLQETLELRAVEPSEVPGIRSTADVVAHWGEEEEPVRLPAATSAPHSQSLDGEDEPPAHTEESVDRVMAADLGYAPFEDPDLAPDDLAEPESAELIAHRTDVLGPPPEEADPARESAEEDIPEGPAQPEPIPFPEPDETADEPCPQDEPTLPSVETEPARVESGLFAVAGEPGEEPSRSDEDLSDDLPDAAAESGPIPRAARETVSRLAAEEVEEPYYDPAVQSVVTPMIPAMDDETTMESPPPAFDSPPIDFDSAMGRPADDEEPPEEDRLSGEESRPLDEPSDESRGSDRPPAPPAIDFDSTMGSPMDDEDDEDDEEPPQDSRPSRVRPPSPPAIDFDGAIGTPDDEDEQDDGDDDEGLGKDFDTFESSYEESFPVDAEDGEEWEGDDFSQRFESVGDDEDRPNMVPYIIGAVVLLVVVVAGAWFAIHSMKSTTRSLEDFDEGSGATAAAEAVTPEELATEEAPTGGEEGATEGEPDALADEEAGDEEAVEEVTDEEPTEAEPPTEEPPTPEPIEEIEEPPIEAPLEPDPPTPDPPAADLWDDEPDWGEEPATEAAPLPADAAAHASELASAGQHAEAVQEYLRAFLSDPNNARTRKEAGWSYIEIGNNSESAKHFRKAVLLNSMDPESHYGLGLAYEGMGRNDDAINEYETYLGLAPNGREAMEVQILLRRLVEMRDGS